jgi:Holliday junction resolvase RusA-like endonuclease
VTALDLFFPGEPAPGGSKHPIFHRRAGGKLVIVRRGGLACPAFSMIDSGKNNKKWRRVVQISARRQYRAHPLAGPIRVLFRFFVRRPKHHHVDGDRRRPLKDRYLDVLFHTSPPDSLKLRRAVEDALNGIVWVDDRLIVQGYDEKVYARTSEPTGCRVMVTEVIPDHAPEGLFSQEAMA